MCLKQFETVVSLLVVYKYIWPASRVKTAAALAVFAADTDEKK